MNPWSTSLALGKYRNYTRSLHSWTTLHSAGRSSIVNLLWRQNFKNYTGIARAEDRPRRGHFNSNMLKRVEETSESTSRWDELERPLLRERQKEVRRFLYNVTESIHDCEAVVVLARRDCDLFAQLYATGSNEWLISTTSHRPVSPYVFIRDTARPSDPERKKKSLRI